MATYQLTLTPVTPVHIGCGEELPGYAYFLDDFWYIYSIDRVLEQLPAAVRLRLVDVATHNVMALAGALQAYPEAMKAAAEAIGGYSEAARLAWETAREHQFQALVQRFVHSQNRAYIPGSSLKGVLRTALLYAYGKPFTAQKTGRDARDLEAETFAYEARRLNTDPFRFLKISDTSVLRDATDLRMLRRAAFHAKEHRWVDQVETLAECTGATLSRLQLSDRDITLRATLTIQEDAHAAASQDGAPPWRFGVGAILAACQHFAEQQLAAERNYTLGLAATESAYTSLTSYAAALPAHATLLRLGFGTGRDSKTVNYLQPKPEESNSRLLVDGVWPLGWVELQIFTAAGKPFTPADDLAWPVPPIQPKLRRTQASEQARAKGAAAQRESAEKTKADAARTAKRQEQLASDFLAFLRKKQGDDQESEG